ncbi:MAG: hypothetical protein G8237_06760 [Magnetococcales bacterium]|nr:hypothetical protein [Magnetococcales bacterium]NGZ06041.1 hypothetical protein [Magnetococcales bacterium]
MTTVAGAAPLDEFLTANPGFQPWHGEGELGVDLMNSTVDLFKLRGDPDPRNPAIGDYRGVHLRGGLALTRRLWVDGGAWSRKIITPYDNGESLTLQGGMQFQVAQAFGAFPAVALRMSGWRDSASEAVKGSSTTVTLGGVTGTAQQIRVAEPRDEQLQWDLISTWNLSNQSTLSFSLGYGKSRVDFDNLFITDLSTDALSVSGQFLIKPHTELNGSRGISGVCVSACDRVLDFTVTDTNGQPVPDGLAIGYQSDYFQVGGMYAWLSPEWRARLGYRFVKWNRDVDTYVTQMGKAVIDSNHFLTGEVGYKPPHKFFEHVGFFLRGQVMMNQFVGEIPFTYNAFSAHKFENRYGLITVGVTGGF